MAEDLPLPDPPAPPSGQAVQITSTILGTPGTATQPGVVITAEGKATAVPTTTEEEDRTTLGQRETSAMWETTQMKIALSVTWVALAIAAWLAIKGADSNVQMASVVFLFGVANLVIGFYFGRTNHQRVGGVMQGR